MPISEVLTVLDRLASAGCRFWLEGGWGVDALVGRQTRPHRDVDVDIDADDEGLALSVLAELGYRVETDWRPNRVELIAPGRGWVDVHPLIVDAEGNARQAALDGGFHQFPKSYFVEGALYGVPIPCFSPAAQRAFRQGYELRDVDQQDLALLDILLGGSPCPRARDLSQGRLG
jgi:lincosamide nucleotidyltransferase A/C/D/E